MAHIEIITERRRTGRLGLTKRKQYRWRIKAANNRIIATSGEGYNNLGDLWHAVRAVTDALSAGLGRGVPVHDIAKD